MVHHSLPGILAPLKEQNDAPKAMRTAIVGGYFTYVVLGAAMLWAFGSHVDQLACLNFGSLPHVITVFLCSYPLMLLSVYPIVSISLRNNLLNFLGLAPIDPKGAIDLKSVLATAVPVVFPLCVAYVTSNVQFIVKIFAGYFGLSLMMLMPCVLLQQARRHIPAAQQGLEFPLRSPWGSTTVRAVILVCWFGMVLFNTYRFLFA